MKKLISIIFILVVSAYQSTSQTKSTDKTKVPISNNQIAEIIDTLASDSYEGRGFGTVGIEKAAVYIEHFFKLNNIKPYFTNYRDSFTVGTKIGYNIVALLEGTDPKLKNEFIILSAHYDHLGKSSTPGDSVFNGANDNASGVSAVLNIVKYFKTNKLNKRSIVVALFSGEEIGLTGSEHFAELLSWKPTDLYCAVNIDMIGSVLTNNPGKVYLTGFGKSNMGTIFNQYIGYNDVANLDNTLIYDVFSLSDNYHLYEKLKIPAHTFCTFDFNNYKYYHRVNDEIKNVNIENTGIIVRNIAMGLAKIANSDSKEIVLSIEK